MSSSHPVYVEHTRCKWSHKSGAKYTCKLARIHVTKRVYKKKQYQKLRSFSQLQIDEIYNFCDKKKDKPSSIIKYSGRNLKENFKQEYENLCPVQKMMEIKWEKKKQWKNSRENEHHIS